MVESQTLYASSVSAVDEDMKREVSDDEYMEAPNISLHKDKEESDFMIFLHRLGSAKFDLPMYYPI